MFTTKKIDIEESPKKKPEQDPMRCPGCPNHCLLNALKCGKGRNLLRQKELLG